MKEKELALSDDLFNCLAFFSMHRFWKRQAGIDVSEERQLIEFPAKNKILFLSYRFSKKEKDFLINRYSLKNVFHISCLKVFMKRLVRNVLYKMKMNAPYSFLKPFSFSNLAKNKVEKIFKTYGVDAFVCEYIWYYDLFGNCYNKENITSIIETQDIQNIFYKSLKEKHGLTKTFVTETDEIQILNKFDYVIAISTKDKLYFDEHLNKNVEILYLPTILYDDRNKKNIIKPKHPFFNIGFVGGNSVFNVDAIEWFIDKVYRFVDCEHIKLNVYGNVCDKISKQYLLPGVSLMGFVDDNQLVYSNNDIMINPTFQPGGLKTKNLESLLYSTPVLTTSVGERGMEEAKDYGCIFIADSAEDFQNQLCFLKDNPEVILSTKNESYLLTYFNKQILSDYKNNILRKKKHERKS